MPSLRFCFGSAGMVLAALFAFNPAAALAAPQALALVATHGEVALTCDGRDCSAELTSFCLDSSRFSPPTGTPYDLTGSGAIRVTGLTGDGRSLSLDPRTNLRFASARRHLAVRVSIPDAVVRGLGLTSVSVSVEEHVALLPRPQAQDDNPISEGEAELLTGPIRELGSRMVDDNSERMQAARVTARMINLLPRGNVGSTSGGEAAWRRAVSQNAEGTLSSAARKRARGAFELCRYVVTVEGSASLRRCLAAQHDGFVDYLNSEFWRAVQAGT